jgi:hypothetical protein
VGGSLMRGINFFLKNEKFDFWGGSLNPEKPVLFKKVFMLQLSLQFYNHLKQSIIQKLEFLCWFQTKQMLNSQKKLHLKI